MMLEIENQKALLTIAARMLGVERFGADAQAIGVRHPDEDRIRAVIVLNQFHNGTCHMSVVSDRTKDWAFPSMFERVARYVFEFLDQNRMVAVIATSHIASQIAAIKGGFQIEARLRNGAMDGGDAILFSMTRETCPWISSGGSDGERTQT
ncbi:GNAT family N-acetyltransferase [Maritimibacter sp. DP1N21-5]|uniref:GNAT family N-acetyltransferase n=1 Tax=Maritimibacter sp. DP1N21-5 TaxID=2836867 RepID=UPI001C44BC21|nr:GNAT family protein [Maritimibacter sp. DP1N21-5]MBV7408769.1 GNAT family N-acetyltransferase [Maritimibacter sp. DP1N21-5]